MPWTRQKAATRQPGALRRICRRLAKDVLSAPLVIGFITDAEIGRQYGVGASKKLALVLRFRRTRKRVQTESQWQEHVELAATLLRIPPTAHGDVIECGCFKGGSSVNLSTVCSLVGRRLVICDSFEGLPEPTSEERMHYSPFTGHYDHYERGRFSASLEEVEGNLTRYGRRDVCDFVVGYFDESLPQVNRSYVMAFFDADLVESLKPCLLHIWPSLSKGGRIYVHEARSLSLVSIFFDREWWHSNLLAEPPGFVGAGTGLPLLPIVGSELGFAAKAGAAGALD